jgi:hypothetical protein
MIFPGSGVVLKRWLRDSLMQGEHAAARKVYSPAAALFQRFVEWALQLA